MDHARRAGPGRFLENVQQIGPAFEGTGAPGAIGSLMDDEVCYVDLFCSSTPRVGVATPTSAKVTMAATHSCGLLPTDAAYCWGRNDESNLGAVSRRSRSRAVGWP